MKSEPAHHAHHDQASHCHNCGAAVSYHYCAVCGQQTRLHVASAGEFIHEFVGHYVALEGRLWQSLRFLLFRPGFLSAEYIAGRRVRYVEPLRLYLTFSLLFFALFKFGGFEVVNVDPPDPRPAVLRLEPGAAGTGRAASAAPLPAAADRPEGPDVHATLAGVNPTLANKVSGFFKKTPQEQNRAFASAFFSYAPYAIFCLMPLFALYLKLLYLGSGRRYGEHLLFALHANAFAYLMLGAAIALPWEFGRFLLIVWLCAYLPLAMRRVYGGRTSLILLRWVVLMLLHLLSIGAAILLAFGLAMVA